MGTEGPYVRRPRAAADPWLPTPWRVEEDWTLEVTAANGRVVHKLPLQCSAEAERIVEAMNREDAP